MRVLEFIRKQKKRIILSALLLLLIVFIYFRSYRSYASPGVYHIAPNSIKIDADTITLDADYGTASFFNVLACESEYEDGNLYLRYRGGWRLPWMKETNNPVYYPIPNEYLDLERIYLRAYPWSKTRLIWTKEGGPVIGFPQYLEDEPGAS